MAGIQERGGSYRLIFRHDGKQYSLPIGKVPPEEAEAKSGQVDYMLLRIKQGLIAVPPGIGIVEFLKHDGKPPELKDPDPAEAPKELTLGELRDKYLAAKAGAKEKSTLATDRIQLGHVTRTLGESFPLPKLAASDLQGHIDRRKIVKTRKGVVRAVTIMKEVNSLRTAWNWAAHMGMISGAFPSKGLSYPKADEPPAFMTRAQIERLPEADRDWEALYLGAAEIGPFLSQVEEHAAHPWIHPMTATAAYTGMRRSELIRARIGDVDLDARTILVRELKRVKGKRTTRRVPLPSTLVDILKGWLATHPGGPYLFCHGDEVPRSKKRSPTTGYKNGKDRPKTLEGRMKGVVRRERPESSPLSPTEASDHLTRTLAKTSWSVVRGYHVLRHSFVSACVAKGVDQRFIDDWVGHTTEQQRRRYRHLAPSSQDEAIESVFG